MVGTLVIWLGLTSLIAAENSLQQVVVITRHGSRELLTKDHKTFVEGGDSPLTIRGMDQMFRAGQFVRRRYGNSTFMSTVYSSQDIYVRSSDYSRTLNSALSFLLGFYPPVRQTLNISYAKVFKAPYKIQQVPIHTVAIENDQVLRGWLDCPVLQERLTNFFRSSEFQKKEAESAALRKELEVITGIEKIELKDFYNVYDYINLHRLYNHTYLNITSKQWKEVVSLTDWIEYHKYSRKMIGSIGGGLLANEIVSSFKKVAANESNVKMLYFSAHYPTMFSLFSALGLNKAQHSPFRMVPNYASLVFFELLRRSNDKKTLVQLYFKNGLEEPLQNYSIPGCRNPCPLDDFVKLVNSLAVRDMATWCNACKNTHLSRCRFPSDTPYSPKAKEPSLSGTGGFFVGVFVTLLFVILLLSAWHFCLRERCMTGNPQRPRKGLSEMEYGTNTGVV